MIYSLMTLLVIAAVVAFAVEHSREVGLLAAASLAVAAASSFFESARRTQREYVNFESALQADVADLSAALARSTPTRRGPLLRVRDTPARKFRRRRVITRPDADARMPSLTAITLAILAAAGAGAGVAESIGDWVDWL